jgi:hypothetical protein
MALLIFYLGHLWQYELGWRHFNNVTSLNHLFIVLSRILDERIVWSHVVEYIGIGICD